MPVPSDETEYGPREAVAEWLTANDIDPSDVPLPSTIVIERDPLAGRSIHYTAVIRSEDGHMQYDPRADGPKVEARTAPLKVETPANVQVSEVEATTDRPGF